MLDVPNASIPLRPAAAVGRAVPVRGTVVRAAVVREVGWKAEWGTVGGAGGNGSSGRHVVKHVLEPLGVTPERTYFTDCLPTYFLKEDSDQASFTVSTPASTSGHVKFAWDEIYGRGPGGDKAHQRWVRARG
jgi:hypothetical protein